MRRKNYVTACSVLHRTYKARVLFSILLFTMTLAACSSKDPMGQTDNNEIYSDIDNAEQNIETEEQEKEDENIEAERNPFKPIEEYESVFSSIEEKQFYAYVQIVDSATPILLLADNTYEYEEGIEATIVCDVYYVWDNEIYELGQISTDGTAYPLRYNETRIYVGGHHYAAKYELDHEEKQLKETERMEVIYSQNDDIYTYYNREAGEEDQKDEAYFLYYMQEMYDNTTVIEFEEIK